MDSVQVREDRSSGLTAAGWSWVEPAADAKPPRKPARKPKEGKLRPGLY